MGQKVNPTGFRLGNTFTWKSRWFATKANYSDVMLEDYKLRNFLQEKLGNAGLDRVDIERSVKSITVHIHVSRPGVVIGKGGANLEEIKKGVESLLNVSKNKKDQVRVDLQVH